MMDLLGQNQLHPLAHTFRSVLTPVSSLALQLGAALSHSWALKAAKSRRPARLRVRAARRALQMPGAPPRCSRGKLETRGVAAPRVNGGRPLCLA